MAYYEFYKVSKRPTNDNAKMALAQQNAIALRVVPACQPPQTLTAHQSRGGRTEYAEIVMTKKAT